MTVVCKVRLSFCFCSSVWMEEGGEGIQTGNK